MEEVALGVFQRAVLVENKGAWFCYKESWLFLVGFWTFWAGFVFGAFITDHAAQNLCSSKLSTFFFKTRKLSTRIKA